MSRTFKYFCTAGKGRECWNHTLIQCDYCMREVRRWYESLKKKPIANMTDGSSLLGKFQDGNVDTDVDSN